MSQRRSDDGKLLFAGMRSEAHIEADDVRTVRQCGAVAVETLRRRANAGAADSVDRLEMETLKEIGKGGGFSNMNNAVQQVRRAPAHLDRWMRCETVEGKPALCLTQSYHSLRVTRGAIIASCPCTE